MTQVKGRSLFFQVFILNLSLQFTGGFCFLCARQGAHIKAVPLDRVRQSNIICAPPARGIFAEVSSPAIFNFIYGARPACFLEDFFPVAPRVFEEWQIPLRSPWF